MSFHERYPSISVNFFPNPPQLVSSIGFQGRTTANLSKSSTYRYIPVYPLLQTPSTLYRVQHLGAGPRRHPDRRAHGSGHGCIGNRCNGTRVGLPVKSQTDGTAHGCGSFPGASGDAFREPHPCAVSSVRKRPVSPTRVPFHLFAIQRGNPT